MRGVRSNDEQEGVLDWPVYHRLESPTQSPAIARIQEQNGEIWGRPPYNGNIPAVQAYVGPLPEGARGIEFRTNVPPNRGSHPRNPYWIGPRSGVEVDDEFAKIKVVVTKNTQY